MYEFPKNLYADVRIEENYNIGLGMKNDEIEADSSSLEKGAMIRVFDGNMWYTATTNHLDEIQQELNHLASLATPNPEIEKHPLVQKLEVHKEKVLLYEGDGDIRRITRTQLMDLTRHYIDACIDREIPEILVWIMGAGCSYERKSFYSSKGAEIVQDYQECRLMAGYGITVGGTTMFGSKFYCKNQFDQLFHKEKEILQERDRYLEYAKGAAPIEPGVYTCVLSPQATAMFVHESFGHKSESDYMLHDETLQKEWISEKSVGNKKVSIGDRGDWLRHGYMPYDDEGTRAKENWLMKKGALVGRLHDAHSAAVLGEELTGNARAADYHCMPIVRMTNTYMEPGTDDVEQMVAEIEDGIYVYNVCSGTGMSAFTMNPDICYRIRNGKICEPVRVNVITGSVFRTLFDIDRVGTDYESVDTCTCGKLGQSIRVSAGGPSIRVKGLTVN